MKASFLFVIGDGKRLHGNNLFCLLPEAWVSHCCRSNLVAKFQRGVQMKHALLSPLLCVVVILFTLATVASGQEQASRLANGPPAREAEAANPAAGQLHPFFIDLLAARGLKNPGRVVDRKLSNLSPHSTGASPRVATLSGAKQATQISAGAASSGSTLPLWTFLAHASRDGHQYPGAMVGRDPFNNPGPTDVATQVIPLIIKTKTVASSFDPKTGIIKTESGATTFNPTEADNVCLSAPNNVPTKLLEQSPIFSPATFSFGGTVVGTTQYSDAFQRANFWDILGAHRADYHVLLNPVQFLQPIVLEVPAVYGLAIKNPLLLGPPPFCTPVGIVDINWFDTLVTGTIIPALAAQGVNPTSFPVFLAYNVVWAAPVTNLNTCCIGGYHGITGFPIPTQTYSPSDFDSSGIFGSNALDTAIVSHEVDEWVNDPMVSNPTTPWGHTGQVGGCQANLEVGDPLTGNDLPTVTMSNGYPYHLQELAFFSWFFGAPSIGVNGWFSNNGTFLQDAGPPCF